MSTERCEHGVVLSTSDVSFQGRCYECEPLEQGELEDLIDEKVEAALEEFKDQLAVGWRNLAMKYQKKDPETVDIPSKLLLDMIEFLSEPGEE